MWRVGIALAAGGILLTNGVVEGLLTNRWHRPVELEASIHNLNRVPMTVGDWHAHAEELDEAVLSRAGIEGYLYRHYENRLTGKKITVLLMCGRPGPLSVHTPDICYRGAGYNVGGTITEWRQEYSNLSAQFRRAKFSKDDAAGGTSLRIAWSWRTDGPWVAPTAPRAAFARSAVLHKLYIVHQEKSSSERSDEELCRSFLSEFLPVLENALTAKTQ